MRALRLRLRLTQEGLGERLGTDDRYVRRLEAGVFNLELDSLARIAKALNVDPAALFGPAMRPRKRGAGRPRLTP